MQCLVYKLYIYLSTEHWYVPVISSWTLLMDRVRCGVEEERDTSAEEMRFAILEHKSAMIQCCCLTSVWCRLGEGELALGQS